MASCHRGAGLGEQPEQIPPADQDARDIGQRIPFDVEHVPIAQPDRQRNWAETEILELDMIAGGGEEMEQHGLVVPRQSFFALR